MATTELSQIISDSKTIGPKELIADAIIDGGHDVNFAQVAERADVSEELIHRITGTDAFRTFIRNRLIQRGFDGVRFQEKVNEISYLIVNEILSRLKDKDKREKMKESALLDLLQTTQKTSKYRAQTEAMQLETYKDRKRLQNPEEAIERMQSTSAGKRFLRGRAQKQLKAAS